MNKAWNNNRYEAKLLKLNLKNNEAEIRKIEVFKLLINRSHIHNYVNRLQAKNMGYPNIEKSWKTQ